MQLKKALDKLAQDVAEEYSEKKNAEVENEGAVTKFADPEIAPEDADFPAHEMNEKMEQAHSACFAAAQAIDKAIKNGATRGFFETEDGALLKEIIDMCISVGDKIEYYFDTGAERSKVRRF